MVRDRRLGHVMTDRDVAGAHGAGQGKLPQDGQPDRVGSGLQQEHVGFDLSLHAASVLTTVYLDKYQYSAHHRASSTGVPS